MPTRASVLRSVKWSWAALVRMNSHSAALRGQKARVRDSVRGSLRRTARIWPSELVQKEWGFIYECGGEKRAGKRRGQARPATKLPACRRKAATTMGLP